jgi:hypothetical protein
LSWKRDPGAWEHPLSSPIAQGGPHEALTARFDQLAELRIDSPAERKESGDCGSIKSWQRLAGNN